MAATIVKYVNNTGKVDFEVVVFAGPSQSRGSSQNVAWHVLNAQSSVEFEYPFQSEIGAFYEQSGQKVTAGPFPVRLGSTWEAVRENADSPLVLKEDTQ